MLIPNLKSIASSLLAAPAISSHATSLQQQQLISECLLYLIQTLAVGVSMSPFLPSNAVVHPRYADPQQLRSCFLMQS